MTQRQLDYVTKTPAPTPNKHNPQKYDTGGPDSVKFTGQRGWVEKAHKAANTNRTKQKNAPATLPLAGRPKA